MISLNVFNNIFDNNTQTKVEFESFSEFEDLLYLLSKRPLESKKSATLISPSSYISGSTRSNKNVIEWTWAAVDVDDHNFEGDLQNELNSRYGAWYFVCYSTASSTLAKPKFRLVFPITKAIPKEKIKHFWFALNKELGGIGDAQTKDFSRMYYIPATYAGSNNFIFSNIGDIINPSKLLSAHPYLEKSKGSSRFFDNMPESMQKKIIDHRKSKLDGGDKYKWNGLHDCPFVSKKMVFEYKAIVESGWYYKLYQFMCSVAFSALSKKYPITEFEIELLARQLDAETGLWYESRPIRDEASDAINFAYKNIEL